MAGFGEATHGRDVVSTPSLDDDDLTIVRWYECERREALPTDTPTHRTATRWTCPWDKTHTHAGPINRRRGSGRRVAAARYHLRQHLAHETPLTVVDVYNLAVRLRAQLHVADGHYRISLAGLTLREGDLRREPVFSGV